jgi:hypothetical protein
MIERIIGVFKLDPKTFEDVEHDPTATGQAARVVAIVAFIGAVGSGFGATFSDSSIIMAFITQFISTFAGWIIWSALTFVVGTNLFDGKADVGEMLRVIGFAFAPQMLGIIPCLGTVVGGIWSLIAGFIAVRQGLDLDNVKTALTIGVGFIGYVVLASILGIFLGGAQMIFG